MIQIQGQDIRPTSDRVREALFSILGPRVKQARVLDLFAGTGALGLEALSRGAGHAVFTDRSQSACRVIQKNIDLCRFTDRAELICLDIISHPFPERIKAPPFDLIFMDPPYNMGYLRKTLEKESLKGLLSPGGMIVAEHSVKESLPESLNGLDISRQKKYSKTRISLLTRTFD
ncbi:16S rRNA (guanine(966)-N(2))-methyltransferase RsmD [Desulfospira joergensenii]|uniref:16S rRNA (guanine(966)-N(2))-methyltransferase RsmD n=1 Tax=Desulfospira joergensenii TaxID=53329 RepID=UPI0003FBBB3D|nr:16S rRNA (guanine(966)-N(2))-methyltransferase RsmD [Desulfospira joergensenii]